MFNPQVMGEYLKALDCLGEVRDIFDPNRFDEPLCMYDPRICDLLDAAVGLVALKFGEFIEVQLKHGQSRSAGDPTQAMIAEVVAAQVRKRESQVKRSADGH